MGITRTRVIMRAKYGWPRVAVPFKRNNLHQPDGYRTDAPGFVSMCYDIPLDTPNNWGGLNTITMLTDGWFYEIDPKDLKPADAIGYLGPESIDMDGGSIAVFEKWLDNDPVHGIALIWSLLPSFPRGLGPDIRGYPVDYRTHAYRFRDIADE